METTAVLCLRAATSTPTEEVIRHLNETFKGKYLLWNLSNEQLDGRLYRALRGQVCEFDWRAPGKSQSPNLVSLLRICYSVKVGAYRCAEVISRPAGGAAFSSNPWFLACQAWLDLDPDHVAFIYCSNGKTRTAIVMACMLRYFEAVSSMRRIVTLSRAFHARSMYSVMTWLCAWALCGHAMGRGYQVEESFRGFQDFCTKRCKEMGLHEVAEKIPPSLQQYFRNFDMVIEARKFPNPEPLILEKVRIQGVPVDDLPVIDILDCEHGKVGDQRSRLAGRDESDVGSWAGSGSLLPAGVLQRERAGKWDGVARGGGHLP